MHISLLSLVQAHTSYRGSAAVCALLQPWLAVGTPCAETIRGWMLRLGLYLLQQPLPQRSDWIWIADHTLQWGTARCLVILGVTRAQLQEHGFCLNHTDVCLLALEVVHHSDGEQVDGQLQSLAQRVGVPQQIVSDHGSDLLKGIRLFQGRHPQVIDTYDITHKLACLLKAVLAKDPRWQEFLRLIAQTAQQVRQTFGSFLLPPTLRNKARYRNIDTQVRWAARLLALADSGDWSSLAQALLTSTDQTQEWFQEKFAWLGGFRGELQIYEQLLFISRCAEEQVREDGLHRDSARDLRERLAKGLGEEPVVQQFAQEVVQFVQEQGGKVPQGQALLGSSEVIESVFGKYKATLERSAWSEIGVNILWLPVLLLGWRAKVLRRALEAVRTKEVWAWAREKIGVSRQGKYPAVFGGSGKSCEGSEASARETGRGPPTKQLASPGGREGACAGVRETATGAAEESPEQFCESSEVCRAPPSDTKAA